VSERERQSRERPWAGSAKSTRTCAGKEQREGEGRRQCEEINTRRKNNERLGKGQEQGEGGGENLVVPAGAAVASHPPVVLRPVPAAHLRHAILHLTVQFKPQWVFHTSLDVQFTPHCASAHVCAPGARMCARALYEHIIRANLVYI
jgi:hypothetical protein